MPQRKSRELEAFMQISLDGYYCDMRGDMTILGRGSIVPQLADAGLIDTFQVVVNPVALGAGKSLFSGLTTPLELVLTNTRVFGNGSVVLWHAPR